MINALVIIIFFLWWRIKINCDLRGLFNLEWFVNCDFHSGFARERHHISIVVVAVIAHRKSIDRHLVNPEVWIWNNRTSFVDYSTKGNIHEPLESRANNGAAIVRAIIDNFIDVILAIWREIMTRIEHIFDELIIECWPINNTTIGQYRNEI